jgi:putative transposase
VPIKDVCAAMDLAASTFYRCCKPEEDARSGNRAKVRSKRSLSEEERQRILCVLHEDRFADKAPAEAYAALLDEGVYLCSIRTMYRILNEHSEVKERRNVLRHPQYKKPELLATAPNQVWSWDITKLRGPAKWTNYYLYVIIDIFSRHAVGWMIAHRENAELAKLLIGETCMRQGIDKDQLFIHSDRGSPMTSKAVALLMSDLGITKSLSRPHVSNDNPFSESQFKTLKYCPTFPDRFGSIEDARAFCVRFFDWYNNEHYHTGLALMTPAMVHYGSAEECNRQRQIVLSKAFEKHPERFVSGPPKVLELPKEVWINPPQPEKKDATISSLTIISDSEVSVR